MPVDTEDPTKPANTDPVGSPDNGIQVEMRALKAKVIAMAVQIATLEGGSTDGLPVGTIVMCGSGVIPSAYLLCDGTAVARAGTYAGLFTAIGIAFGPGDGVATFNLPDLRGRSPIGAGTGVGLTTRVMGAKLGEEEHTITTAELPAHDHALLFHGATADTDTQNQIGGDLLGSNGIGVAGTADVGANTGLRGDGTPADVLHPVQVVNYMIKATA